MSLSPIEQMKADARQAQYRMKRIHDGGVDPAALKRRFVAPKGRYKAITPKAGVEAPAKPKPVPKSPRQLPERTRIAQQRRKKVAKLCAQGLSVSEIARRIGVDRHTVYSDRRLNSEAEQ